MGIFDSLFDENVVKNNEPKTVNDETSSYNFLSMNSLDGEDDPKIIEAKRNLDENRKEQERLKQEEEQRREELRQLVELAKKLPATTLESYGNKKFEIVGEVFGNIAQSKFNLKDFGASFKNIFGGEVKTYTKLNSVARERAVNRMKLEAINKKADAVIGMRIETSMTSLAGDTMATATAYGTAIKFVD